MGCAFHNIPHLCLSPLQSVLYSVFVVRMHLYGQLFLSIDKLYEQWKLIAETPIILFSNKVAFQQSHQVVEFHAFILSIGNNALIVFHARHFPTLAYLVHFDIELLERYYLVAAP